MFNTVTTTRQRRLPCGWSVRGRRPWEGPCHCCGCRGSRRSCQAVELVAVSIQPLGKCAGRALRVEPLAGGFPSSGPIALHRRGQLSHIGFGTSNLAVEARQLGGNEVVPSALSVTGRPG